MVCFRIPNGILINSLKLRSEIPQQSCLGMATKTKYGVIHPEPHRTSFGILRVILTVVPGLLIGAAISKNIANFLEENELFVPADDDDDDD